MKMDLSDRFIAKAKAGDWFDSKVRGLHVRVLPSGVRTWSLMFTVPGTGKRARLSLGQYPTTALARARTLAMEAHEKIEQGIDPRNETQGGMTVADLAENYLRRHVATLKAAAGVERRLRTDVLPLIGKVKLSDLHRRDAHRVLDAMHDRGVTAGALRTFADLRAMVRWGVGRGDIEHDPFAVMKAPDALPPRERVLSDDEIKTLWKAWPTVLQAPTAIALKLVLATGQRIGEVAGMTVDELDLERRLWTLPAARTKNGHSHEVPLSDLALELIAEARAQSPRGDRILPGVKTTCVASAIIAHRDDFSVQNWRSHDLRRTAVTNMAILGVLPHVVAHVANHRAVTKGSITAKFYDQHSYEREKREALDLWADRLSGIVAGAAKVVSLRSA